MTRIRAWLRNHSTQLVIGVWLTTGLVGWALVVVGIAQVHGPSAWMVAGLGLVGLAVTAAVGE